MNTVASGKRHVTSAVFIIKYALGGPIQVFVLTSAQTPQERQKAEAT